MTIFDDRERGFEAKFAAKQKGRFDAQARQTKLLGLWAARQMGLKAAEAESYAQALVRADVDKVGQGDVVERIIADLAGRGIAVSAADVRKGLDRHSHEK
jgi:hypothetical protein